MSDGRVPGLIRLHGSLIIRRAGWLDANQQPTCPYKHPVREHGKLLEGRGVYGCKFKHGRGETECGALIYIVRVPNIGNYCADVTAEEMRHMEAMQMTGGQVFNYLGVHFAAGSIVSERKSA